MKPSTPSKGSTRAVVGVALAGVVAIVLAALAWYPPLRQPGYAPAGSGPFLTVQDEADGARVNVNTATLEELTVLPGIGETKALAIIEHREQNGPFAGPEDLLVISGIGPKTLEGLEELICF